MINLFVSTICFIRISSSFCIIGDESIGPKFSAECFAIQDRICDRVCKCESRPPAELGPPRPSMQSGYNHFLSFSYFLCLFLSYSFSLSLSLLRHLPSQTDTTIKKRSWDRARTAAERMRGLDIMIWTLSAGGMDDERSWN